MDSDTKATLWASLIIVVAAIGIRILTWGGIIAIAVFLLNLYFDFL